MTVAVPNNTLLTKRGNMVTLPTSLYRYIVLNFPQTLAAIASMALDRRRQPVEWERKGILREGGDDLYRALIPDPRRHR